MCGLAGVYNQSGSPFGKEHMVRMADAIEHRGPDGEGFYFDKNLCLI